MKTFVGTVAIIIVTIIMTLLFVRATCKTKLATCTQPLFFDTCSTTWDSDTGNAPFPKTVIQTWKSEDHVPERIKQTMRTYASDYTYVFFDDTSCRTWMGRMYPQILPIYDSLKKGAHKADLFRYCYLYIHGGIWIDIKTIPLKPLSKIFSNRYEIYTAKSITNTSGSTCFQGVLAVPPKSAFMRDMISSFIMIVPYMMKDDLDSYLIFCRQMFNYFEKHYATVTVGRNISSVLPPLNMFEEAQCEECTRKRKGMSSRPDCLYLRDSSGENVFQVRDDEFPWR